MTGKNQHKIDRLVACEKQLKEMRTWLEPIHEHYHYNTDKELVEIISKIDLFLGYVASDIGGIRADLWQEWEGQDEKQISNT